MPKWTKDQEAAINTRGGKVIVSAAAGSGKTAVLSERVLEYVLNGGNINDLLIVTFTKAAANEMKVRIKSKIIESYEKTKSDHLKKQIVLMDVAKINTIDSFYGEIVKDNFNKLGINKNYNMLSSYEEGIISDKVMKDVLESSFNDVKDYENMLIMLGAKDANLIKDIILKISSFLDSTVNKDIFINKIKDNYHSNLYKNILLDDIKNKINSFILLYDDVKEELYNESSCFDKLLENISKELNYLHDLIGINNLNDLSSRLRTIEFDRLKTPTGHKDDAVIIKYKAIRDEFKTYITKDIKELSYIDDNTYDEEKLLMSKTFDTLFEVVGKYQKRLLEEKLSINSFTFSDISHFVIELLYKDGNITDLAKELSNKYTEILIDEYQDTNNIQNVIFNAISCDGKKLFIVGDVKQSIYRFRSACPEIFNGDKESATKDSFPRLITLSKNFRSRKEVLDFCNFIFSNTMTNKFGEVNYDENEMLYLGASFEEKDDLKTEVYIIDGKEKDEENELTKAEKEAVFVADKIKYILNNNYEIYDNKKSTWRSVKASDIVILLRSLSNASLYKEALDKRKISSYLESTTEYFDNYEIKLVINILKIIDNLYDDVALLSFLISPLLNISLDEITEVRLLDKNKYLYENIISSDDTKLKEILLSIKELKEYSYNNSVWQLINKIYNDYSVIPIMKALNEGYKREKNLIQMLNHAVNYESNEINSLHSFISYIEKIILNNDSLEGINPLSDGDNVLITTIHKSKGLEYPIVILSETGKSFNFQDMRQDFMINDDLGACFNIRDDKYKLKYESVAMMVFKQYEKKKMISEELRILYVALTRAKEKIIITGYDNNLEKSVINTLSKIGDESIISDLYLSDTKCYLDVIRACLIRHPDGDILRSYSNIYPKVFLSDSKLKIDVIPSAVINEKEFKEEKIIETENLDINWIKKVFGFKYKDSNYLIPTYMSVSDIKKNDNIIELPNFMKDGYAANKLGTLYHKILELLPVKKYNSSELSNELNNLVSLDYLKSDELKLVDNNKLLNFLTSELYDLLIKSDKYYKEYEITFKVPSFYYDNNLKSGKILTSGIIDLLFFYDDAYYIVDYKTDNVNDLIELKDRYKIQLDLYEIGIKDLFNCDKVVKIIYSIKFGKYIII